MKRATSVLSAAVLLPALLGGADGGACQIAKGTWEDRLALVQKQAPAEGPNSASLMASGSGGKVAAIDSDYRRLLAELLAATQSADGARLKACCEQAAADRAGALVCGLALYLNGGRKDSAAFLEAFPSSRKETAALWEMNAVFATPGQTLYPPKGPAYKLIDELFLLMMDERDTAVAKYFNVATHSTGAEAAYMDAQIRTFLKEAPAAVVNQWLVLRRYRPKLKAAAESLISSSSPAEMLKLNRAVRSFCEKSNPDCPDILKLYGGR